MKAKQKHHSHKQVLLRQKAIMKQIRRRNDFLRRKNIIRYRGRIVRAIPAYTDDEGRLVTVAQLPKVFSINNLEECIKFTNQVTVGVADDKFIDIIHFDLSEIEEIDYLGICFVLSLANKLVGRSVSTKGNYPKKKEARQFIINSGFCELVSTNVRKSLDNIPKNILYTIGGNSVYNKKIGSSIQETVFRLTGHKGHYAPVYENMLEICANSVEHGNSRVCDKNWLVSISFTDDYALFILMDNGDGILRTLKRKTRELFEDLILFKSDGEVLNGVFNKKYQSATKEINRHKGLPNILNSYRNGYIDELIVITNKVFYIFSEEKYIKLKNEFRGTAYLWKVTKGNIEKYNHGN